MLTNTLNEGTATAKTPNQQTNKTKQQKQNTLKKQQQKPTETRKQLQLSTEPIFQRKTLHLDKSETTSNCSNSFFKEINRDRQEERGSKQSLGTDAV